MVDQNMQFVVPPQVEVEELISMIEERVSSREEGSATMVRVYYDSFDCRLYAADGVLAAHESGPVTKTLCWGTLDGITINGTLSVSRVPRFVWDFPPGELRSRLEPILKMRALLPQARVQSARRTFRVLNNEQKTVTRWAVDTHTLLLNERGETTQHLGNTVQIFPMKGYDKAANRMGRLMQYDLQLPPAQLPLLLNALEAQGRHPSDYSSKLNLKLQPDMRADAATKMILLHLLNTLERNEAGTRADIDSEFLHDFRVAVRRTRSALSQIKGVFPPAETTHYQEEFRWLGRITSPTRDMDVYLLKYSDYSAELSPAVRDDLTPLHAFLVAQQDKEHRALVKALDSARFARLLKAWRVFLESSATTGDLVNAARPVTQVASKRIWRVYRRVLEEGQAITPDSPAEALHDLRKTCKKLRYLMEFFQSLYPPAEIKQLIKTLKVLQNNLGDFQDFEVQASYLKWFGEQMLEAGNTPATSLMAMGILVERLLNRQQQVRTEFANRFVTFSRPKNQKQFKALFGK